MTRTAREFIGERAIEALRRPALDEARGLPAALYTSQEFFDIEQRRLFPRVWTGIAFDTDVPGPGDAIPLTVCGLPVILVRDGSGEVRVLHNVCRHRATIVLERAARGLSTFKCPYHGWVYGTDGALKATPFWDGTANSRKRPIDAAGNGLVPVRSGVWNHVVFVNLDGRAEPLETWLAPMTAELAHLDVQGLELGHRLDWKFKANWKLVMENWEVYHHVWVHEGVFDKMSDEVDPATGEPYTDMIADGNVMILRYRQNRPPDARRSADGPPLPPVPARYEKTGPTGSANAVLPNTTVSIGATAYAPAIYVPIAPGLTEARMAWYFAPGAATGERFEASREAVLDRWLGPSRSFGARQGIRSQDHRCMELQQAARVSPIADDVRFSATWEANVRYFQDWLVTRIDA